jgi:D-alanyl-D-alanine carboxypeptidase/D-alanyl-D-alanine-endopeptidase (penicillin-binding protein 4)
MRRTRSSTTRSALAVLVLVLMATAARAELPRPVARAFLDAGVPLTHVAVLVQRVDVPRPLFWHQPDVPMNPASTMKLVTTFAALELLGRDYRWRTEAYLGGDLVDGTLHGDLVLKGHGDPKITVEHWRQLIADLRAKGLERIEGDLVLDRSHFGLTAHDPAAFDAEPLRPYNVGPDALLVNFKTVRFAFEPNGADDAVELQVEPPLPHVAVGPPPALVDGDCGNWRQAVSGWFVNEPAVAAATFSGQYPRGCGPREWHVALLDHSAYVHGMFEHYFAEAGGTFAGMVRDGRAPAAKPFAVLESSPLQDVIRDINKLSNNVMARQLFLTLATASAPPPATLDGARSASSPSRDSRSTTARDCRATSASRPAGSPSFSRLRMRARCARSSRRRSRSPRPTARSSGACAMAALPAGHSSSPARWKACALSRATCRMPGAHGGSWWRSSTTRTPRAHRARSTSSPTGHRATP